MKTLITSKKTILYAVLLASGMLFSQCDSKNYKEPDDTNNQREVIPGEDQKEGAAYNEEEAMYPAEKVINNTNLTDNQPLEVEGTFQSIDKDILLSTLNLQKTLVSDRIEALQNAPGNSADSSILQGDVTKLKTYLENLDIVITKVRSANEQNFDEVADLAQGTIKGAGALMQSDRIQIQQGF